MKMPRTKILSKRKCSGNQYIKESKVSSAEQPKKKRGRPSKASYTVRPEEVIVNDATVRPTLAQEVDNTPCTSTPNYEGQPPKSASFRKLYRRYHNMDETATNANQEMCDTGYRMLDIEILSSVFQLLLCPECSSNSLQFGENLRKKNGCASLLVVRCSECLWCHEFYSSQKIRGGFEVNQRLVYGMRNIGHGFSGAKRFCAVMNIPHLPTKNNYGKLNKTLKSAVFNVAAESMRKAGEEVRSIIGETTAECGVSVDGCWQKRGYVSLNGCITTISTDNGKILDVEAMSRYCKECEFYNKLDKNSARYETWKANHSNCKADFKGSAPAMEPEGAERIFKRSFEKHGLHYTKFYGDGDSKSYGRVKNVYEDKPVVKYECIGHVQKRVGTALRKLKKDRKEMRGKGKLTDKMIDKLQNYYGIAIRSNVGNLEGMKKAILATLFHCSSSADKPYHTYCPIGKDSWCMFQADKANNTSKFKPGPGLPLTIIAVLKPVFARLSQDQLLKKCLHGKTQNQNESFNRMIWDRVPKSRYVGKDTFDLGVHDAVANFNMGAAASIEILKVLNITPGIFTEKNCNDIDNSRIYSGEYKEKDSSKLSRKKLRSKRKSKDDKDKDKEGITYGAGQF